MLLSLFIHFQITHKHGHYEVEMHSTCVGNSQKAGARATCINLYRTESPSPPPPPYLPHSPPLALAAVKRSVTFTNCLLLNEQPIIGRTGGNGLFSLNTPYRLCGEAARRETIVYARDRKAII